MMQRLVGCMDCGRKFPVDPEHPYVNVCPQCEEDEDQYTQAPPQPVYVLPQSAPRSVVTGAPPRSSTAPDRPRVTRGVPCGACGRLLIGEAGKTDARGVRYCNTLCLAGIAFKLKTLKAPTGQTCVGPSLDPGVLCGEPLTKRQRMYCSDACAQAAYRLRHSAVVLEAPAITRPCAGPGCPFTAAAGSDYCADGAACRKRVSRARAKEREAAS